MRKQFKNISLLVFLLSLFITGGSHAAPKDIQSIIDTAKLGHLTEDMHKKYWDWANSFGNSGDDDSLKLKKILNWYPKINRLQLQYNRELIKSLKLTLKKKEISFSERYEDSYQNMKNGMLALPFRKGSKEYADIYRSIIISFKQSKNGVDLMFKSAATGELVTSPYDKDIQMVVDSQYILTVEASIEQGWKNLLILFNPNWSN
ncbi:MAG: hypothetical protein HN474_08335 [Nitrospina sp.]|nr:hypothetical protein [Nitrospina sp.]